MSEKLHVKRPRTALLTAAIWRSDGYKQCRGCLCMKAPADFRPPRSICVSCENQRRRDREHFAQVRRSVKHGPELVRVPVKGWGCI